VHVGYRINDQFTVFAKGNNLFNQDYQRYLNFPVQGVQVLAGATYQFDF
jgi:outer membrane receptor protein involved in Fe transport